MALCNSDMMEMCDLHLWGLYRTFCHWSVADRLLRGLYASFMYLETFIVQQSNSHRCQFKLYYANDKVCISLVSSVGIDFSEFWGLSHDGNVDCGQTNLYSRLYSYQMKAMCLIQIFEIFERCALLLTGHLFLFFCFLKHRNTFCIYKKGMAEEEDGTDT